MNDAWSAHWLCNWKCQVIKSAKDPFGRICVSNNLEGIEKNLIRSNGSMNQEPLQNISHASEYLNLM